MKRVRLAIAVIGVVLSFLLTVGNVAHAERGVTNDEIRIGCTIDLSGPAAFLGQGLKEGLDLYFKYLNDQGGIYGRKIKFLVEDDGFLSPRSVQGAKKLVSKDHVFFMTMNLGGTNIQAMLPFLEENKVPIIWAGTPNEALAIPPKKYVFLGDSGYGIQGSIAMKYVVETVKFKNPKVAVIYSDEISGMQLLKGVKNACAKFGIKDVLELPYKRATVDFSSQIALCKKEGITHIVVKATVREPALIMKEAQRIQYKANFIYDNGSHAPKVLELAGDSVAYANGVYVLGIIRDINTDDTKALRLYKQARDKYKSRIDSTQVYYAFGVGMLLQEVLQRAGKNPTTESLIKAAESLKNYDNGINNPITWAPDRRDGGRSSRLFKATDKGWIPVTDWMNH